MSSKPSDQTTDAGTRDGGADGSLGEQLRRARLARGISLREISDQTRITMRHLEAIESGDYKHLPGGIFNRSFIKAFARAVGFNEQRALDLYAREQRDRGENPDEVTTTPHRSRIYTDGDVGRSPVFNFALSALLVGILCLGIYALWYAYDRRFGSSSKPGNTSATNAQANTAQAAQQQTPAPTDDVQVQIRTKGKKFWVRVEQGKQRLFAGSLESGKTEGPFKLEEGLNIVFDDNAPHLEVLINDQAAKMPPGQTGSWLITKQNYQEFLR